MACVLALAAVSGCGGGQTLSAPASVAEAAPRRPPLPLPLRPKFFLLPGDREVPGAIEDPDGTRRMLLQGVRLTVHPDGAISRGEELFPYNEVAAIELPERLGGGVLFHALSAGDTLIWKAESWTSKLEPLARLGFVAQRVVPGFDRLLVHAKSSNEVVALDVTDGRVLDDTGLPAAPGVRHLAFADAWMGVVDLPIRGTLVTFDAGATWTSLGLGPSRGLAAEAGSVVIERPDRNLALDPTGRLLVKESMERPEAESSEEDSEPQVPARPGGPLGREPLREAVLHGWPDSATSAVVAARGHLGRVRLSDGRVTAVNKDAFPASEECHALALGGGFGFVCGREDGPTTIYAFDPPLSLREVLRFDGPRFVASSGNGALVVRGGCRTADGPDATRYCIITPTGLLREIRVKGDRGVERVVALHDGRTAVLVPPRFGAPGRVTLVEANGSMKSVKMKLPKDGAKRSMTRQGLWLDGFVETQKGQLAGWVVAGGPFVGVRVSLDGKVAVGTIENEVERALLSGSVGMVLGRSGLAAETTDGGFRWRELDLPVDVDAAANGQAMRGCSRVGCMYGDWVRIGWQGRKGKGDPLGEARTPRASVTVGGRSGGRWLIECAPTAEVRRGRLQGQMLAAPPSPSQSPHWGSPGVLTADTVQGTAWASHEGVPAPRRAAGDVGFDYAVRSEDAVVRAYAWGPRAADWARVGKWVIRGSDPFALEDAVWSTTDTRSPWDDVVEAARAFGQNVYGSPSPSWTVSTEPSGRGGMLFVTQSSGTELYLFEENRSIVKVADAAALGVNGAAGVVKTGGRWYVGAQRESFRIFEVVGDEIRLVGDYPMLTDNSSRSAMQTTVVRNDSGDGLAIWVRANRTRGSETMWYVYPVDPDSGAVSEPVVVDRATLAKMPDACRDGDSGWELVGAPPVSPFVDVHDDPRGLTTPRSVQARMRVGANGLCVDALSAELESPIPAQPRPAPSDWAGRRVTVPMFVSDGSGSGARWKFRCTR